MSRLLRYLLAGALIFCLILIRAFETKMFYDPFLAYFKGDFYNIEFPVYDMYKTALNIFYRYFLNSLISVLAVWLIFNSKKYALYSTYILAGFFVILLPIYLYFISIEFSLGENVGFYIRRFLIQPVMLLILIPAFFYHQSSAKE